jgi:hypothetical protein
MITGAGGSIGAELARIVAGFGPEQVQLVERAENPLFEIDRQIARRFPGIGRRAVSTTSSRPSRPSASWWTSSRTSCSTPRPTSTCPSWRTTPPTP